MSLHFRPFVAEKNHKDLILFEWHHILSLIWTTGDLFVKCMKVIKRNAPHSFTEFRVMPTTGYVLFTQNQKISDQQLDDILTVNMITSESMWALPFKLIKTITKHPSTD